MAIPRSREGRAFFRAAFQRKVDADLLLDNDRTTGAVYLAGYAVECGLKTLMFEIVPVKVHADLFAEFCGRRAHDFDWLLKRYGQLGGPLVPPEMIKELTYLNSWTTDLRYSPALIKLADAEDFVASPLQFLSFVERRI